jgi:hypothetical protein
MRYSESLEGQHISPKRECYGVFHTHPFVQLKNGNNYNNVTTSYSLPTTTRKLTR